MSIRKITILIVALCLAGATAVAQKMAYVDYEYIMKHIPEYAEAENKLDALSKQWQAEVDKQYQEVEQMYQAYQKDQASLNEDLRRRREDEIVNKEKSVKDFQREKFGFEGELFQQREALMKPVQERVNQAIKDVAASEQLDFIMDRRTEATLLYANPALDKSNEVISKLGLKPNPYLAN